MNKRIVILGGGESGVGAAVLAKKQGFEVFVSDFGEMKPEYKALLEKHRIAYEEKTHEGATALLNSPLRGAGGLEVIKSPGIPDKAPIIKKIKERGIPIVSEIEFAGRYTDAKTICITGSNGKTTTTMLTYHILKNAGVNVGLAGNVGRSFALQVAEERHDWYVIELSSFQLDNMYEFKADIAVMTNITPDHLDRYNYEFRNYADAKFRILQNMDKNCAFIYWAGDPIMNEALRMKNEELTMQLFPFDIKKKENTKAYIENKNLIMETKNKELFTMPVNNLSLSGTHNTYNSMAAALSASLAGISNEQIRRSLSDFEGVEHRLEYVASVRGVRFINDSKATNVNSTWYALESMTTPVVLIAGGTDKGNDYTEIEQLVRQKVHTLVCLGTDNRKLLEFFADKVPVIAEARSMTEAVRQAYAAARKGDTVLLSPCCASFDLFMNYEDRGRQFKEQVKAL